MIACTDRAMTDAAAKPATGVGYPMVRWSRPVLKASGISTFLDRWRECDARIGMERREECRLFCLVFLRFSKDRGSTMRGMEWREEWRQLRLCVRQARMVTDFANTRRVALAETFGRAQRQRGVLTPQLEAKFGQSPSWAMHRSTDMYTIVHCAQQWQWQGGGTVRVATLNVLSRTNVQRSYT